MFFYYKKLLLNRKGVNFLEMLIAVLILGMSMVPIMNMYTFTTRKMMVITTYSIANRLAQEKLEEYRHRAYDNLAKIAEGTKNGGYFAEKMNLTEQENALGQKIYNRADYKKFLRPITVQKLGKKSNHSIKIVVKVMWQDKMIKAEEAGRCVMLSTIVSNYKMIEN